MKKEPALGYRDPMTYKNGANRSKASRLTTHVMNMNMLAMGNENELSHQYMFELMEGKDPTESEWFKKAEPRARLKASQRHISIPIDGIMF